MEPLGDPAWLKWVHKHPTATHRMVIAIVFGTVAALFYIQVWA